MPRLKVDDVMKEEFVPVTDFDNLVISYAQNKQEADDYAKICKEQNTQIKEYLHTNKITGTEVGEYTVTLTTIDKSSMNPDRLLEFCKKHGLESCIRTKEYVDENILETLIYNGEVDADTIVAMNSCKDEKFQENLYVKKTKKKKESKND